MPTLQVGKTSIDYDLRRSSGNAERRITVTPERVEVLALADDTDGDVAAFLQRKREWLFKTVREVAQAAASRHAVPRLMTGSKVLYRGRKMALTVRRSDAPKVSVTYRNGFWVDLPDWVGEAPDEVVATELRLWLKSRARQEAKAATGRLGRRASLTPRSVRVADMTHGWGSCGPEGNILINWHLILAPPKVFDYVVAHELAHLRHRSHGAPFWDLLESIIPGHEEPKAWLERHQSILSSSFLNL